MLKPGSSHRTKRSKGDTSIETYNLKRDFNKTKEPPGAASGSSKIGGELLYVIQKHEASHLHYDFRLEMEGVLRSICWLPVVRPAPYTW